MARTLSQPQQTRQLPCKVLFLTLLFIYTIRVTNKRSRERSTLLNLIRDLEAENERLRRRKDSVIVDSGSDDEEQEKKEDAVSERPAKAETGRNGVMSIPFLVLSPLPELGEEDGKVLLDFPTETNKIRILDPIPEFHSLTSFTTPVPNSSTGPISRPISRGKEMAKEKEQGVLQLIIGDNLEPSADDEADRIEKMVRDRVLKTVDIAFGVCRKQGRFRIDDEYDELIEGGCGHGEGQENKV
ncbi:hypothetical protein K504DRAFT_449444 [Pleomassaria siparia CBS 279.74]|uniref:Uncharacterized protein n=1 Tax=Pleomassaria siparia CBS 279.74 TaxID=1314801 RepID=A0A6G1JVA2_9PLEO|nr:hypothetical protein K504DRAFT_449444 [Pleomassaria siparia CBS 279.74]